MSFGISVVDTIPKIGKRGRGLSEKTKSIIDYAKSNRGKIIKVELGDKTNCKNVYLCLKFYNDRHNVFSKLTRRNNCLYLVARE